MGASISSESIDDIEHVYADFRRVLDRSDIFDALDWLSDADDAVVARAQSDRLGLVHEVVRCTDHHTRMQGFRRLVVLKANFSAKDDKGESPLHVAARMQDLVAAKILIHLGANPNVLDAAGRTPLHWSAVAGRVRLTVLLIEAGSWLHVRDRDGKTFSDLAPSNLNERLEALSAIRRLSSRIDMRLNELDTTRDMAMGEGEYRLHDGE